MAFNKLIKPLTLRFKNVKELWEKAEAAAGKGNQSEANEIYGYLVSRKRHGVDDYSYAALAEARLGRQQGAMQTLEDAILKFPGADTLIEQYSDLCLESCSLDRIIQFLAPAAGRNDSAIEGVLTNITISPIVRKTLIDHFLSSGVPESAQAGIRHFQESPVDSPVLWDFGDLMLKHSRANDAKLVYQVLSNIKIARPEDCLYSALADYRLGNTSGSLDKFEAGLGKFSDSDYLFENYLRVAAESGQIGRAIRYKENSFASVEEACKSLFNSRFADSFIQINIIKYAFTKELSAFAEKSLDIVQEKYDDNMTLWKIGDLLLEWKRHEQAKSLYRRLAARELGSVEDYYYSALAQQRLENIDKFYDVLELGLKRYPNATLLFSLYIEVCTERYEFESYSRLVEQFSDGVGSEVLTAIDFYKLAIRNGAPISFVVNFKDIELKCSTSEFSLLKNEFFLSLRVKAKLFDQSKLLLFYGKYLDLDGEFMSCLLEFLVHHSIESDAEFETKRYQLELIYNLTVPMITHYPVKLEEVTQKFVDGGRILTKEKVELKEPISDMSSDWMPWQYIFCLATPQMYTQAITKFEQVVFKTWPKLNYISPYIAKKSYQENGEKRKIRIGFTVHDSMPMMSGLMSRLNKDIFYTVYLRPGRAGNSKVAASWVADADETVEYSSTDSYLAINTIADEKLDIIISGPCLPAIFYPLMARLAPLQMILLEPNWMDGLLNTDYYISWKPAEPDNHHDFYKAAVSFMNHPPYWIERPAASKDLVLSEASKADTRRRLLGRRSETRIYLCANTPPKIHPEMDELFLRLLEKDPTATLAILRGDYPPAKSLKARLKEKLGTYYDNVVFLPTLSKDDAHQLLMSVDCCLDSYPLCGMSSSFDGAMLGVPIVTLPADIPFGRWTTAIYEYIGVSGLVATDREDYVDIAVKLASDKTWREQKSAEIKEKSVRYVESEASFNEFQSFIIESWKRKLSDMPPTDYIQGQWQEQQNQQRMP